MLHSMVSDLSAADANGTTKTKEKHKYINIYKSGLYHYHFGVWDGLFYSKMPLVSDYTLNVSNISNAAFTD